ncbi:MAG: glycosyltransferase, partial [Bacteroidales bacterium]|nr:glycosyltransferase [Bacteroidales bacterium]
GAVAQQPIPAREALGTCARHAPQPAEATRLFRDGLIERTENVGKLAALYATATAFVNPTWQDNYPTVNLEAIACGTPVVTYRTGGSIEAVTEGTGFVVEQGDVAGMLARVRELAAGDRAATAEKCRAFALAHFRKEDCYQNYIRLYENLAAR